MIDALLDIDQQVFSLINQGLSNDVFDWLLPPIRNKYTWIPLYAFLIFALIKHYGKQSLVYILFAVCTVFAADTISSKLIKKTVERPRPCHIVDQFPNTKVRVDCGGGYSFTSSHATNHFAVAWYFMLIPLFSRRRWQILFLFWASMICLAQVYVGVHYPLDVLAGGFIGSLIGWTMHHIARRFLRRFKMA